VSKDALLIVCSIAILTVIPALSVLYREFLDANSPRTSALLTTAIAGCSAAVWILLSSFIPGVVLTPLQVPTASLAAVAGFICSLPLRDATARPIPALVYSATWVALVFFPVAVISLFPQVFALSPTQSPLDLGAALPVHVTAGTAALVVVLLSKHDPKHNREHLRPRSWFMLASGLLLWVGWTAALVGLELDIDKMTPVILLNCLVGPAWSVLGWLIMQRIRSATTTAQGAVAGLLCGLVAVTAGCAYLDSVWSAVIGATGGIACSLFVGGRVAATRRPAWFFVGAHLMAGGLGLILLGLFGTGYGLIFTGQIMSLQVQFVFTLGTIVWTALVSVALWPVVRKSLARQSLKRARITVAE
jgi:ammonia channel protein AmtB